MGAAAVIVDDSTDARTELVESAPRPESNRARTVAALVIWTGLIVATVVWGRHLQRAGARLAIGAPPLAGQFGWRVSADALLPIGFGFAVVAFMPWIAERVPWRWLLALGAVTAALWAVTLSRIDGRRALAGPLRKAGYLQAARLIHDPRVFLSQFVPRIHSYSSHVRGHPPGMEILLWATARVGLQGVGWNVFLALAGGAAAAVAALVALRECTDERYAHAAMPFVILAPGAIWWSSGDPFFAGVSAWAVTLVILATGKERRDADRLALVGGLLFGITAFLSYGLVLLAFIPIGVAVHRRRMRPLLVALIGVAAVFGAFALAGFSWFAGLAATRTQYWLGAARHRPYTYFLFADLAAFALAVGPAAAVAMARLRNRKVWLLVGGALAAIVLADISGMSKAEVERIWLPFVPWVLLATAAFAAGRRPRRSIRFWLGVQVAGAVLIEMAVRSPW
jgi:methylthioxylose transferase